MTSTKPFPTTLNNTLLPTTMVGSYPRPGWFTQQLSERDFLSAIKDWRFQEAFVDAVRSVINDQEKAGLDLVTDGQMWFDDYTMGIGSFLWYWFERIEGFDHAKLPHPALAKAIDADLMLLDEVGGVQVSGKIGPQRKLRLPQLFSIAQGTTKVPVKCCVGAGPVQLSGLTHVKGSPYKDQREVAFALAEVFNAEMKELVAAGAKYIQLEDLGAWYPNIAGEKNYNWVADVINKTVEGVDAFISYHFCLGNAWGNMAHGMTCGGYTKVLPHYFDLNIDEFVLDFACRDMCDIGVLKDLPKNKRIAAGVIDVRSLEVEAPEQVAEHVRPLLKVVDADRITLTTDCGMKQLPRVCARNKLKAMVDGAEIIRKEING